MSRPSKHSMEDRERVRELAVGRTVREVSEITGIGASLLRNWSHRYGIEFVSHSAGCPPRSEKALRAKELLDAGNAVPRVALILGIRNSTLRNWGTRYDWDIQEPRSAGVNCDTCKHPQKHLCSQFWCACEVNRDITPPEVEPSDD